VNRRGVDFYHRLIDSLLQHGITPWVTMFHLGPAAGPRGPRRLARAGRAGGVRTYADTIVQAYGDVSKLDHAE